MATEVGEKVRALRTQKGYTLETLADLAGTCKSRIWELENRDNARPTAEKIHKIAIALDVTPEYLMATGAEPPNEEEVDRAFYRKYKRMSTETKSKIRAMVKLWSKE